MLSRKSTFILLKPELSPSREAAGKFLSAKAVRKKKLSENCPKIVLWLFLFAAGPGRDAQAGFCTQTGGIPAKNISPCHSCAGTPLEMGRVSLIGRKTSEMLVWCCAGMGSHPRKATATGTGTHTGKGLIHFIYT